ncbi:MAG: type IV toxin-antitoxin system AbiEi family antitoxin domain-containing protein [Gordonibacter sp.]|uniref:type IV toxin-antitoxin system AbiEi family antitoxin domain-containing protein n=1 Tax=Gordonibacter sp. TaxID=1968902 RepID=UPI002FC9EF34
MKTLAALRIIKATASYQWGFVTTAQMQKQGVERIILSRLAKEGYLSRFQQGVYKDAAVPASRYDLIRSTWLSFLPERRQFERVANLPKEYVITGAAGAYLWDVGDLNPEPLTFVCNVRRQTTRLGVRLIKAPVNADEIELVEGLPVAKLERIICDLAAEREDLSLIGDVLADARRHHIPIDNKRLIDNLAPYARRYGLVNNQGKALLNLIEGGSKG